MRKTVRRGRVRLLPYVEPELAERLDKFCAASDATESAVVGAAIQQYLDGTSDATLLLRRLDRLGRALARSQRDIELLSEAFAVFTRVWFAHTPTVPEDGKKLARTMAESRYRQFVEHVIEQFSGGRRFLDDLPRESIGADGELATLRQQDRVG
jgi:predicted DNA-binding protein